MPIESAFLATLGADAESKVSKSDRPYLRLNCRVDDGEKAQWISVMAFDQDAIAAAAKFVKGAAVYVEGKLSLSKWNGQDGAERTGLSCLSWHCRLSQIGRNKTRRTRHIGAPSVAAGVADFGAVGDQAKPRTDFDDEIPW